MIPTKNTVWEKLLKQHDVEYSQVLKELNIVLKEQWCLDDSAQL